MAENVAIIRPAGGGFDVIVEPPIEGVASMDREGFADHRGAYGYACGLRMTHRVTIVDASRGGTRAAKTKDRQHG